MSGQRQKNRPEQGVPAFPAKDRSEAPKAAGQGTETLMAKRRTESLAGSERLSEEVCELENCKQALQRVKANKGRPGIDGMTVDELPDYLKLKVNQAKSAVARPGERKFLGFSFTSEREPRRRIAPKAIARFKKQIRKLTRRTRGISLAQRVQQITTYLHGWLGYFGDCQTPSVLQNLEMWLRRRLRAVVWKQWKHGRKRFR